MPIASTTASASAATYVERLARVDRHAELERDAELREHAGLRRQGLREESVRRDRIARETARLGPLVVDRDLVAERGELAGADEAGRAGADHGDAQPVVRRALPERHLCGERDVARIALEAADLDRLAPLVLENAGAFAEELDRADARARSAEQVLGEDDPGGAGRVVPGDRGDELRHGDTGRARGHARGLRVGPAAFEAPVGLHERLGVLERGRQLVENQPRGGGDGRHDPSVALGPPGGIGASAERGCGKRAASATRSLIV